MTERAADLALLGRLRTLASGSVALLALLLVAHMTLGPPPDRGRAAAWTAPVALLGLVSPVIGFRLVAWRSERAPSDLSPADRRGAYSRALLAALATTGALAALGLWVHVVSGAVAPLAGLAGHTLLVGALWPTPESLEGFGAAP